VTVRKPVGTADFTRPGLADYLLSEHSRWLFGRFERNDHMLVVEHTLSTNSLTAETLVRVVHAIHDAACTAGAHARHDRGGEARGVLSGTASWASRSLHFVGAEVRGDERERAHPAALGAAVTGTDPRGVAVPRLRRQRGLQKPRLSAVFSFSERLR
jgi:hypothetical protein